MKLDICVLVLGLYVPVFFLSGMPSMSRSHICVDLSLYPSSRLIEIGSIAGCKLFTGVPGQNKCPVAPESYTAYLFVILIIDVECTVSIVLGVWLLIIVVFQRHHRLHLWLVVQIYCRYFVRWGTTSLQRLVLDCVYLFYPFLILFPLTVIHTIVAVSNAASMCPVGPSPSSFLELLC